MINKIREALNDNTQTPRFLETVPRLGYRFIAPVERSSAEHSLDQVVSSPPPSISEPPPVSGPRQTGFARPRSYSVWIMSAGAFFLGCCVTLLVRSSRFGMPPTPGWHGATPLTTFPGATLSPSLSPDGKQLAFTWDHEGTTGRQIYTMSVGGGGFKRLTHNSYSDRMPVWSPDGRQIAFLRVFADSRLEIWVMDSQGQQERKVGDAGNVVTGEHQLAWTKDSNAVIASMRIPAEDPPALFLISIRTGERSRLTSPDVRSGGDSNPSVSPDGFRLAFARTTATSRDIFVVPLSREFAAGGAPVRITESTLLVGAIAWSPDGRALVFAGAPGPFAVNRLFHVAASGLTTDLASADLGIEGTAPALSPDGKVLFYVRENVQQTAIMNLSPLAADPIAGFRSARLISSTRSDFCPDLSRDGKHLAFSSARTGSLEIWISDSDGANLRRITSFGGVTPRWSPDGRQLTYVSGVFSPQDVYVYDMDSGASRRITSEPTRNIFPTWSQDGKHLYFGSNRSGKWQVYKAPNTGGPATQITRGGGFYAVEALDGQQVYYTSAEGVADIRSVPTDGGEESVLLKGVTTGYSAVGARRDGLYYFSNVTEKSARMNFFSFATGTASPIFTIDFPVDRIFSGNPDDGSITYVRTERRDSDLMQIPYRSER